MNSQHLKAIFGGTLLSIILGGTGVAQTAPATGGPAAVAPALPAAPPAAAPPGASPPWYGKTKPGHDPGSPRGPIDEGLPDPCHAEKPPEWCKKPK